MFAVHAVLPCRTSAVCAEVTSVLSERHHVRFPRGPLNEKVTCFHRVTSAVPNVQFSYKAWKRG